ncbi:hypothetical protein PSHT_02640 [Puccinia striiformis]|uniref:alpha-1,2-Mannosidase n=1 Tax=Puccinia striiformis TaxID=27350 RepID=A0A2S4WHD5_9BASI|nr:hypothetical protein PSHT_02640 [Puccinia striiformis]
MPSGPMVVAHLLSHWTGNNSYRARADETSRHITNKPPTFPGRHSPSSTLSNGPPVSEIVSWGDKLNSHLGYGVKYWQLAGEPAMYYMKHWQDTVVVLIEHLLQWSPGNNHPYLAGYLQARGGHPSDMSQLSCFAPSNWMLGGKLLQNEAIFMLGVGMAETCYQMDSSSRESHGSDVRPKRKTPWQVVNTKLFIRPEVAETIWYAWRLTRDTQWQERAWSLFLASEIHFKSTGGNYLHKDSNIDSCSPKHNSTFVQPFLSLSSTARNKRCPRYFPFGFGILSDSYSSLILAFLVAFVHRSSETFLFDDGNHVERKEMLLI